MAALLLLCAHGAAAQSADDIIKRHVKAAGGEKALRAVASVRYEGEVLAADGHSIGTFIFQLRRPDCFYEEFSPAGMAAAANSGNGPATANTNAGWILAYNGRTGWREDAAGPATVSTSEQARLRAAALYRNDRFLNYKKDKSRAQLMIRDSVGGRPAFLIEFTSRNAVKRRIWFDAQTYLIVKEDQQHEGAREEYEFSDYRAVDGVQEPHRIALRRNGRELNIRVRSVVHNPQMAAGIFDFPARAAAALPDLAGLLKEVEKNQEHLEAIVNDYTFDVKRIEYEVDDKGAVKNKTDVDYEVFHIGRRQFRRMVMRNGSPLSAEDKKKEDERIEKRIKEYEEDKRKEDEKKKKVEARAQVRGEGEKKKDEDEDDFTVADFLRVSQLVNPRRERFHGREVLVLEIQPRPGYKARNRAESLVQKLAGAMWIDEQAKQIVRAEARMLEDFKMGGGMVARFDKGSAFVFEQEMVNNEVWLPLYTEVNASARVLLVKGFKINQVERYSNYKKFRVETQIKPIPPEN